MAKVIRLRLKTAWDSRKARIRQDVADLLAMLSYVKEHELGKPVEKLALLPIDLGRLAPLQGVRIEEVEELGGVRLGNPWAERDAQVPGLFNRATRTITVAKKDPRTQQRFTIAHEFGHLLYHSSPLHLRERIAKAGSPQSVALSIDERTNRAEECEADVFAAELLMPGELVQAAMSAHFGGAIDGTLPREELAYLLGTGTKRPLKPMQLARMPQIERAKLVAQADSFGRGPFKPLIELFDVSTDAMAVRLLELDLVS